MTTTVWKLSVADWSLGGVAADTPEEAKVLLVQALANAGGARGSVAAFERCYGPINATVDDGPL